MTTFIICFAVAIIIFLIGLYIGSANRTEYEYEDTELEYERSQLISEVNELMAQRDQLLAERASVLNIQPNLQQALDAYQDSHIRIPSDVIEDATRQYFSNVSDALNYIENQRDAWKRENGKKVYK